MNGISESWGFVLGKLTQEMDNQFSYKLKKFDITSRDYGVLSTVNSNPNLTQKEIGALMQIDRTTMVQLVDFLENKKYVTREINPKDRRQNIIRITSLGNDIVTQMWQSMKQIERKVIEESQDYQKQVILEIAQLLEEK